MLFSTLFAARARNVESINDNRTVVEFDGAIKVAMVVSCWTRALNSVVPHRCPTPKKNWGAGNTPAFERYDAHLSTRCEVQVAMLINLEPGSEDFNPDLDDKWPARIRHWPSSVEVEPVVINSETGQPIDCPDWFRDTLAALRAGYYHEAERFKALLGDRYDERVASLDHPLVTRTDLSLVAA